MDIERKRMLWAQVVLTAAITAIFAVIVTTDDAEPAPAPVLCAKWSDIRAQYAITYGEKPVSSGVMTDRLVLQVLASPDGATWTAVVVQADGTGCVIAVGTGWEPGRNPVVEVRG